MSTDSTRQSAKRIVLLSDGTGNSSAKLMKTNVWRMYQGLDYSDGNQVAMYDNGVGSSSFRPWALLSGAMGLGLKRNVLDLYMFACRNFAAEQDADRPTPELYLFGFSRGAFTARVLAGLIASQGLIVNALGDDLERLASFEYRAYRRKRFAVKAPRPGKKQDGFRSPWYSRILSAMWDRSLRLLDRIIYFRRMRLDAAEHAWPTIRFLGLWDTVAAYGLPVDEMTTGWDRWVWKLTLPDRIRLRCVDKVCHALALDDERLSFHPTMFDESTEVLRSHGSGDGAAADQRIANRDGEPSGDAVTELAAHTDDEHLTQVWFAGMHSDVGGGYPDDAMAHVPLCWMADEVCKAGLRIRQDALREWRARANANGPMHDSRRGPASYYRYKPRLVSEVCRDRFRGVHVARPKIHESVFRRIMTGRCDYAPIVLPDRYAIVQDGGAILDNGTASPYEHPEATTVRAAKQANVWDVVWWRRLAYFANVGATLLLVGIPFFGRGLWPKRFDFAANGSKAVIDAAAVALPSYAAPWLRYYREHPILLWFILLCLLGLFVWSGRLQRMIGQQMLQTWSVVGASGAHGAPLPTERPGLVHRIRTSALYLWLFEHLTQEVVPFLSGMGALLTLLLVGVAVPLRLAFALAGANGMICRDATVLAPAPDGTWRTSFDSSNKCSATGIELRAGRTYEVRVELPTDNWSDASRKVTSLTGFGTFEQLNPAFVLGLPFRRVLTQRWFVPIARIGAAGPVDYSPLRENPTLITPRFDGQLFLFVNDAIAIPYGRLYHNNKGSAQVSVTERRTP